MSSWSEAVQMVTRWFPQGNKPDEEQIASTLRFAADYLHLNNDSAGFERTFRELRKLFNEKIPEGITLTDSSTTWMEWLPELKQAEHWSTSRWDAYYRYLQEKENADWTQLQPLDKSTDAILSLLSDPRHDCPSVARKGLVLGDVQSGKTRTYVALMNKAVDCGYKLVIVLTSDNENLRQQTQARVDSDFLGLSGPRTRVGISEYLPRNAKTPLSLTNEDDFVKAYDKAFRSFPRPSWDGPSSFVAVIKKNASILNKFTKWLDNPEFAKDIPVLIIDDESDYASVNSARSDDSPTRINSLLRKLCKISQRTSYVAVTATPFANIFIDDSIEPDLFPKDFIHIMPTPYSYIGAKRLFGDLDSPAEQEGCVKELDDDELDGWLPLNHKKDYSFEGHLRDNEEPLDAQVRYALDYFLIACVLRPNSEEKRQSMLIHMSRFTEVQRQIADMVQTFIGNISNALRFHENDSDPRIHYLHTVFDQEYRSKDSAADSVTWEKVLQKLKLLTSRLQVRLVNSKAGPWNDANQIPFEVASNECTIYIGGDQLSRGMTLKGLICSIFYRRVTASDTLLQMGRWFGYRPEYAQYQRIWLIQQSITDYRYSYSIVEELKESTQRMKRQGMTPKQFGIAIRKNPNKGVRITNYSKMRNAQETNGQLAEFNLAGEIIESIRLSANKERIRSNNSAFAQLIDSCKHDSQVLNREDRQSKTVIFQHVPGQTVAEFLEKYRSGYNDKYFGPTLMQYRDRDPIELKTSMAAEYAKTQAIENSDITWNIAFINGEGKQSNSVTFPWTEVTRSSSYEKDHDVFAISGKKMRLASKTDIMKVASVVSPIPVEKQEGTERQYYLTKYFGENPTLMFYRVSVKPDRKKYEYLAPTKGQGWLAVKIAIPVDEFDDGKNRGKAVYYYNTVATKQQYELLREQAERDGEE